MKSSILTYLSAIVLITISCSKTDSSSSSPANNSNQTGSIKVSVGTNITSPTNYTYYLGQITVELFNSGGAVIATQYLPGGGGNTDFGQYAYGSYKVQVKATLFSIKNSSGSQSQLGTLLNSSNFNVDASTKNINLNISN